MDAVGGTSSSAQFAPYLLYQSTPYTSLAYTSKFNPEKSQFSAWSEDSKPDKSFIVIYSFVPVIKTFIVVSGSRVVIVKSQVIVIRSRIIALWI